MSQSTPIGTPHLLDSAQRLVAAGAIQLKKRGAIRPPQPVEALALLLGALGTVDRWAGVKTMNIDVDGQPAALAVIENARFGQDAQGSTTLSAIVNIEKSQNL